MRLLSETKRALSELSLSDYECHYSKLTPQPLSSRFNRENIAVFRGYVSPGVSNATRRSRIST